jgi:hypothetical protein
MAGRHPAALLDNPRPRVHAPSKVISQESAPFPM